MRILVLALLSAALLLASCSSGERLTEGQKDRRAESLFAGELSD